MSRSFFFIIVQRYNIFRYITYNRVIPQLPRSDDTPTSHASVEPVAGALLRQGVVPLAVQLASATGAYWQVHHHALCWSTASAVPRNCTW